MAEKSSEDIVLYYVVVDFEFHYEGYASLVLVLVCWFSCEGCCN